MEFPRSSWPWVSMDIFWNCTMHTGIMEGGRPFGYLQRAAKEFNSRQPRTNAASGRIDSLNPQPQHCNLQNMTNIMVCKICDYIQTLIIVTKFLNYRFANLERSSKYRSQFHIYKHKQSGFRLLIFSLSYN